MRIRTVGLRLTWAMWATFASIGVAQAQIRVTEARIGCLDSATANEGNLTRFVGDACNGKLYCSYKAPDEKTYRSWGVQAHTKSFCTQAMEITYQCGNGASKSTEVPGDAWKHGPAELFCEAPAPPAGSGPQNPNAVAPLQALVDKYQWCILEGAESDESQKDAIAQTRKTGEQTCLDGNQCTYTYRSVTFSELQQQAKRGDPTNFEAKLHSAILNDCFKCKLHNRYHTKQTHCTIMAHGNNGIIAGPYFESCKAGVDVSQDFNDITNDIRNVLKEIGHVVAEVGKDIGKAGEDIKCGALITAIGVGTAVLGPAVAAVIPPEALAAGIPGAEQVVSVGAQVIENAPHHYPLVQFNEDFIAKFIDALNGIVPIENRNIYLMGGSTGGMLTLRMGHRPDPWIKKIVAWNPASVWTTYSHDFLKGFALKTGFDRSDEAPDEAKDPGKRADYFNQVYGKPTPLTQPNPEEWYRGDRDHYPSNNGAPTPFRAEWDCTNSPYHSKWDYIAGARLENQEVYNAVYRRWHWRFGTEELAFSFFNDSWTGPANTASGKPGSIPNYDGIHKPTLLVASDDDDWNVGGVDCGDLHANLHWEDRWTQTKNMAGLMRNTPGRTLFIPDTGHSIHNERPLFFADQIVDFLSGPAPASGPLQVLPPVVEAKMRAENKNCKLQLPRISPSLGIPSQFLARVPQFPAIPGQLLATPQSATFLMEQARLGGSFSDGRLPGTYSPRLTTDLRQVANAKSPALAMGHAAALYYRGETEFGSTFADLAVSGKGFQTLGNVCVGPAGTNKCVDLAVSAAAFADLAVTGRNAYAAFEAQHPTDQQVELAARNVLNPPVSGPRAPHPPVQQIDETKLQNAVRAARTRAYKVAWALRNPNPEAAFQLRNTLGWIAVSGEDDSPDRPVNVPSGLPMFDASGTQISAYPQYDVPVTMQCQPKHPPSCPCVGQGAGNVVFQVRYSIASPQSGPTAGQPSTNPPYQVGVLPPVAKPAIPTGDEIILYIHGGPGSRLEEASDLVEPLHAAGLAKGKRYTVISFDQPSQGYSSMIDPACVVPPHD